MFDGLIDVLLDFVFYLLYLLFSGTCFLIDFLKNVFYKLCGLDVVDMKGEYSDILTNLISSDVIKRIFLIIFLIGFILIFIFSMVGILRSNLTDKQTPKTVLSKALQAFIISVLIPFIIFSGILLINTIMSSINQAMNAYNVGSTSTIGGQFLVTIGDGAYKGSIGERILIESKFVSGEFKYTDVDLVKEYYTLGDMHFMIGILGSFVMLVMFLLSSLTFVQRIFDVVLLYILSPICISSMPLDEGARFKVWKDMMISKLLSAFGIILVMNLFFIIMPQVNKIKFFDDNFSNGVVYILFLIGGSFALTKASRVISQLSGAQASGGEMAQMIYNIRSGLAFTRASKMLIGGSMAKIIAGNDYKKNRKKGATRSEALKEEFKSKRNQYVPKTDNPSKARRVLGAPFRLATMPIGMMRDLSQGGLIQVGKNFIPRLRNVFKGGTITNKAQVKRKENLEEAVKKGKEEANNTNNSNNDNLDEDNSKKEESSQDNTLKNDEKEDNSQKENSSHNNNMTNDKKDNEVTGSSNDNFDDIKLDDEGEV